MAKRGGTSVEAEHHINAIRMRVTGSGNLNLQLTDLNDVRTSILTNLALATSTRIEPTRLANFQSQRTRLVGRVTELNEHFHIRRIIIFAKPVAVEYPG